MGQLSSILETLSRRSRGSLQPAPVVPVLPKVLYPSVLSSSDPGSAVSRFLNCWKSAICSMAAAVLQAPCHCLQPLSEPSAPRGLLLALWSIERM